MTAGAMGRRGRAFCPAGWGAVLLLLGGCGLTAFDEGIDEFLVSRMDALHITGLSVALVGEEGLLFSNSYGYANGETGEIADGDTLFKLASLTKIVTATAVMQLYERGVLDLHRDISRYLPFEVRHPAYPAAAITMHMLLTHTSGIRDNWSIIEKDFTKREPDENDIPNLKDTCRGYLTAGGAWYDRGANFLPSEPGSRTEYANMGITLAGLIVEEISGEEFQRYCADHIFTPLGMGDGICFPNTPTTWPTPPITNTALFPPMSVRPIPQGFILVRPGIFPS